MTERTGQHGETEQRRRTEINTDFRFSPLLRCSVWTRFLHSLRLLERSR
jgi:hypothetical protein